MLRRISNYYNEVSDREITIKTVENYIMLILKLIDKIIRIIDKNSSSKIEMIFSAKHRKKLRISQFLILLTKIFKIYILNTKKFSTDITTQIQSFSSKILPSAKSVFDKTNLASVRFYLDSFYMSYSLINTNFLEYLISKLRDPFTKPNLVTSCLIVILI